MRRWRFLADPARSTGAAATSVPHPIAGGTASGPRAGGVVSEAVIAVDARVPIDHPVLREQLARALAGLQRRLRHGVPNRAPAAARCAAELDAGEITDKGYVNQRRVLERRADRCSGCIPSPSKPGMHHAERPMSPPRERAGGKVGPR